MASKRAKKYEQERAREYFSSGQAEEDNEFFLEYLKEEKKKAKELRRIIKTEPHKYVYVKTYESKDPIRIIDIRYVDKEKSFYGKSLQTGKWVYITHLMDAYTSPE